MKIIHIIGLVGSGKSKFIKKYLNSHEVFDIKDIYTQYQFEPKDLKDPQKYSQFHSAIDYTLKNMVNFLEKNGEEALIVESSGSNKAINSALFPYEKIIILITSEKNEEIYQNRQYARELNRILLSELEQGKIHFDIEFNWNKNRFIGQIPDQFKRFFPKKIVS